MNRLTDEELLEELRIRIAENKNYLQEQKDLMQQLQIANAKLQESEQLKSLFLSNVRNEINNPLTSILGLSHNIFSLKEPDIEKIRSLAVLIHEEAFNLEFQLQNIFAATEIEAGEYIPQISYVDIHTLIYDVVSSFQNHLLKKKNIQVQFDFTIGAEKELIFKTDSQKLHLVLSNLLFNAIEFSNSSSELWIKVWIKDNELHISVQDFGIGINPSELKAIFDRFKQLDYGTTKKYKGHGLGLAVCKSILDQLNGSILVTSTEKKGSTFTITLPEMQCQSAMEDFSSNGNDFLFNQAEQF